MPDRTTIVPPALRGAYDNWHFAPAVVANGLIFCSGIIGTSVDGELPRRTVAGQTAGTAGALEGARSTAGDADAALATLVAVRDPEAQFATAFEALDAILAEAGASLAEVIEITTYHVDIARHMAVFMRVKDRYLKAPYPAWTAIGVAELIVPGGLMEIRAVAIAPASAG
jgi:enamine deaminase RidA (YjgF/YER057c/UK114 family)